MYHWKLQRVLEAGEKARMKRACVHRLETWLMLPKWSVVSMQSTPKSQLVLFFTKLERLGWVEFPRDLASRLRALGCSSKDPHWAHNTHMAGHDLCNSSPRGTWRPLLASLCTVILSYKIRPYLKREKERKIKGSKEGEMRKGYIMQEMWRLKELVTGGDEHRVAFGTVQTC